ncbi:MAG: thioredoxin domain-containing protein, partial [Planctomycetota bacterium]
RWLVPHFEKMLHDQALLALAYTEAFELTRKPEHERTAREVLDYVLRDLSLPEGGFASAEDADSEGREGAFYVWRLDEIMTALGAEEGRLYAQAHGASEAGNFRDPHHPDLEGLNVLHLPRIPDADLRARLEVSRRKLFEIRSRRPRPLRDDKVLTDWNGLAIGALARAARAFDEPRYAQAARRAADFLWERLRGRDGRLLKRWRQGEAGFPAVLDDYAFAVFGLIELYQATFDPVLLERALAWTGAMLELFGEEKAGALYLTARDGEALFVRAQESYDGAIPSGNSVAAENLTRLAHLTGRMELAARAEGIFRGFAGEIARGPAGHTRMLTALDFHLGPSAEVVIAGPPAAEDVRSMLRVLRSRFLPNVVVLLRPDGDEEPAIARIAPFTAEQRALGGRATAYVCRNFACDRPTHDAQELLRAVEKP